MIRKRHQKSQHKKRTFREPQKKKRIELLAPAGDFIGLKAAINAGADSVYFGLKDFSARSSAKNFSIKEIREVVELCHKNGVRAYLAMNTLVKNHEIKKFFGLLKDAYNSGIDAVIVQHISFIPLIRKNFPDLKIHASTQANLQNSKAVKFSKADRVVLPRELNLDEIKDIKKKTKIGLEIFVHGALCLCYSGQCLMSSMIGGRSGNRGRCAQPCRRRYNGRYLLSTRDLCLIKKLPAIIESGVECIKIEGRMRSTNYISETVGIYRKAIENYYNGKFNVTEGDITRLKQVFNREFTEGHFANDKSMIASEKPMNRGVKLGVFQNGMIKLEEDLAIGDGVSVWKKDKTIGGKIESIYLFGRSVKSANKGSIVKVNSIGAENGDKIFKTSAPTIKKINVSYKRTRITYSRKRVDFSLPKEIFRKGKENQLLVKVNSVADCKLANQSGANIVYYDVFAKDVFSAKRKIEKGKCFLELPATMNDEDIVKAKKVVEKVHPDGVLISNIGCLSEKWGCVEHLNINLNCFNDIDLNFFNKFAIVSPELSLRDLAGFTNKNFGVLAHGKLKVMTTKTKIITGALSDEKNEKFLSVEKNGEFEIYNSKDLGFFNEIPKMKTRGIGSFVLNLDQDVEKFVQIYRKILDGEKINTNKMRRGHTTGHLYRGVL